MANITNGTVSVTITGGVGPYRYTLLNAGNLQPIPQNAYATFTNPINNVSQESITFGDSTDETGNSGLASGSYRVRVIDGNDCETISGELVVSNEAVDICESFGVASSSTSLANTNCDIFTVDNTTITEADTLVDSSGGGSGGGSGPTPTATAQLSSGGGGGQSGLAPTPTDTPVFSNIPTPTPAETPGGGLGSGIPDPTATVVPDPTATVVPDPTSTPVPDPTSTPVPDPTATVVPDPTATVVPPTSTPVPDPTATVVPDPTSTPVPDPTATVVPDPTSTLVPDPTSTPVPDPTATVVPPTSTPVPDPTSTPVPDSPGYAFHLGNGGYPYAQDLINDPLYSSTSGASTVDFATLFTDMLANPGSYESVVTVPTISDGTQIVYPISTAQNYYWLLLPDSMGIPDLTQVSKLADIQNMTPDIAIAKLATTIDGEQSTLYRINLQPTNVGLTIQYID